MLTRRTLLGSLAGGLATPAATPTEWLGIAPASALIRARKLSPLELTRGLLNRIQQLNPRLNAFVTVMAESALAQARELEIEQMRGRFRGPLHGIPIGVKDLYDTAGVKTTAASAHFAVRVPSSDAAIVAKLRQAGVIVIGKLNMDEFAFNFTSETSSFGVTHNPWKHGYTPGGSSGGSAAALAAGFCLGALGSDTGGSIRLPAALCGISGFKPTYGRLSTEGVLPLAWSLDHAGPMARSAADARLLLEGMGLTATRSVPDLKRIRLGLPRAIYWERLSPEVERAATTAVETLARITAGHKQMTLPPLAMDPQMSVLPLHYGTIIMAEAFAYHEQRFREHPEKFHPATLANLKIGAATGLAAYIHARREMDQARAAASNLFGEADVLVMPAAPGPAFKMNGAGDLIYLRNLAPWNYYGLPAISVPCGFTAEGLPIGLQIVGPAGADALVLHLAQAYENASTWNSRRAHNSGC